MESCSVSTSPSNHTCIHACVSTTLLASCALFGSRPTYAAVLKRPPPALEAAATPITTTTPNATTTPTATNATKKAAPKPLLGKPAVVLPLSQLTLGRTSPPWNASAWNIDTCEVRDNSMLRVYYPKGSSNFGTRPKGGCNFKAKPRCLPGTDVAFHYKVRFAKGFEWSKGGKLPGLFVGEGVASGGRHSKDAASFRLMWKKDGYVVAYVYVPSGIRQPVSYIKAAEEGDEFGDTLFAKARLKLRDNLRWNDLVLRLKLNTFEDGGGDPRPDGMLSLCVNEQVVTLQGIVWRRHAGLKVSSLLLTSFYGGKWRCPSDTYAEFTDFTCVS